MGSINGGGPCGACKFLRRKCVKNCVFAPYFDSDDQGTTHFAAVHRVFGASNAAKLLLRVPVDRRVDAVVSLCYEALCRVRDPVYGCMGNVFNLQRQIDNLQAELSYIRAQISILEHAHQPDDLTSSLNIFRSPTPMTSSNVSLQNPNVDISRNQESEENDLELLAREFLVNYAARVDG